jgi:hypothetical protein
LRDHRIHPRSEPAAITGGSAFNSKAGERAASGETQSIQSRRIIVVGA